MLKKEKNLKNDRSESRVGPFNLIFAFCTNSCFFFRICWLAVIFNLSVTKVLSVLVFPLYFCFLPDNICGIFVVKYILNIILSDVIIFSKSISLGKRKWKRDVTVLVQSNKHYLGPIMCLGPCCGKGCKRSNTYILLLQALEFYLGNNVHVWNSLWKSLKQ